jgi:hypothetical protein
LLGLWPAGSRATAGGEDQRSGLQARGTSKPNPNIALAGRAGHRQPRTRCAQGGLAPLRTQGARATVPKTAATMLTA